MKASAQIRDQLRQLERQIRAGAAAGMARAAAEVEGVALATESYEDDTGATRAGTLAFVAGDGDSGRGRVREAAAEVEYLNPGSAVVEAITGPARGDLALILTAITSYSAFLELRDPFIGDTLQAEAPRVVEAIRDGVREALA